MEREIGGENIHLSPSKRKQYHLTEWTTCDNIRKGNQMIYQVRLVTISGIEYIEKITVEDDNVETAEKYAIDLHNHPVNDEPIQYTATSVYMR
jgi:hypothetical protein